MQDYLAKNKDVLKGNIRGFFCVQGNMKKPTGPENVNSLLMVTFQLYRRYRVPGKCFNGRITLSLLEPNESKMMSEMGMEDYDFMKRGDFLDFGKEILASVK
jgi:hypothetical protein